MTTPRADGDYSHDEAHDLVHGHVPATPSHHPRSPAAALPPVQEDGDYGYDQAHDFGRNA